MCIFYIVTKKYGPHHPQCVFPEKGKENLKTKISETKTNIHMYNKRLKELLKTFKKKLKILRVFINPWNEG